MWRTILVDDEEFVRAELAALFPWEHYQFELSGEAESAQVAIDLVNSIRPDLVITDIRMPQMDGLELTSWLAEHHPEVVVAIVSAYNDFPLVREALRLGAADYLIKAEATFDTAEAFLKQINLILLRRTVIRHRQEEMSQYVKEYQLLATEPFWRDILTRASDDLEIKVRSGQLGIDLQQKSFGLLMIHLCRYHEWLQERQFRVRETLNGRIKASLGGNWI